MDINLCDRDSIRNDIIRVLASAQRFIAISRKTQHIYNVVYSPTEIYNATCGFHPTVGYTFLGLLRLVRWNGRYGSNVLVSYLPFSVTVTNAWGLAWWRDQMETFFVLLDLCAGNSPVSGEFPLQRPVTQSFDIFFDLHLNKRLG